MALGTETEADLKMAFQDIRELKVDVAFPFLLELYHDYENKLLSNGDLLKAARLVESYVFRRAVCDIPTNSMNKTFATITKGIKKDRYLESIQANFLLLPSYRRFPDNDEFKLALQRKNLYKFRGASYWLRRLENFDRKERMIVDEYTIEHIMPQNENLSSQWKAELGPDWERIQKTYLHTLGNLTLTGYNSEYSDRPFLEKRNMKGGFAESPLKLNKDVGNQEHWNEMTIKKRAEILAEQATMVWTIPTLDVKTLDSYKPKKSSESTCTLEDYPFLANDPLKSVFAELRKQILILDPCVTEEVLKLYIAYKAETNFVDIVPQAKRLRLSLNVEFSEINDPKGICKDVSALGRWGNGDVEVGVSSIEEIPYTIGLIRQAFEKQMGNGME
jgi:predicted transport protein